LFRVFLISFDIFPGNQSGEGRLGSRAADNQSAFAPERKTPNGICYNQKKRKNDENESRFVALL
jgi:hypothetical protein